MVLAEPYKIKMVEPIKLLDAKGRKKAIEEAGYNTFLLRSDDVYVDLLTDSGTGAMSDNQWAGIMLGDEAYAGSRNFYAMEKAVKEVLGYEYTVPTHQGRGAEHLLYKTMTKPGDVVPRNMYFTTSRQHVELPGGLMVDAIIDEAHDPDNNHPFKGNMDIKKLQGYVDKYGKEKIPFINVELNVNMAGGQPVSLQNLREVKKFADEYKIPVVLDATRLSENAFFIKEREKEFKDLTITQIIHEMTKCSDSCVYSAKKDCIVNIGGFVATHNKEIFEK
ncbi:MAG: tyrosine phenol-lyase, partial [Candidatus Diapherotrites archaeon CG08_land_8_20_14_0_20_34_12]